jgi:archaellum biogenesis ATPase FlaH
MTKKEQFDQKKIPVGGVEKIRTMIEGFDDISHGGLPVGRTTLVSGTSGTGKTLLSLQFLALPTLTNQEYLSPLKNPPVTLLKIPIFLIGICKI